MFNSLFSLSVTALFFSMSNVQSWAQTTAPTPKTIAPATTTATTTVTTAPAVKNVPNLPAADVALKSNNRPNQGTIALVNGEKIMLSEFKLALEVALRTPQPQSVSSERLLDKVVNRTLVLQDAKKAGSDQDLALKKLLEEVLYGYHLEKTLGTDAQKLTVTDQEVMDYYSTHPEYDTSNILIRLPLFPTPKDLDEAFDRIQKIYLEVKSSPNLFDQRAKEFSETPNHQESGRIGFVPQSSMLPEYREAIQQKPIGFITPVIRTQLGFHIVKVNAIKTLKDNKDQIDVLLYRKILLDQKKEALAQQYFDRLKKSGNITLFKENLP